MAALGWFASLLAEAFDGRIDLDAAMAAAALGGIPAALAKAVMDWPLIGWFAPVLLLWSLLLWRGLLGFALRIDTGRSAHLFAVLMGALLVMIAVGWQLRDLLDAGPPVRMGRLWLV
ncbi:MAG: hypothetical protein JJU06_18450 [Ectothiorhodospiraceae bacterium]|nr:hypothetical protein [Ectothiorhodospiraceae bacterium]